MTTDGNESPRVDVLTRDESGRFAKGASGNPAGRPVGVKNYGSSLRLTDIYRDLSPMLLEDLMERFRSGDEKARDFLLPRLWPESPKFAAYMHEKAKEEEEWKEKTRNEIEEEIKLKLEREDEETKNYYLKYYLPEVLIELFTHRGNFRIPKDLVDYIKPKDIDRAYLPCFENMDSASATLFAANLVHAVIMKPAAARAALETALFSEWMIYMVFESIRDKHGSALSGLMFINLVDACLSQNLSESEYKSRFGALDCEVKAINRAEREANERMSIAMYNYEEEGESGEVRDDDSEDVVLDEPSELNN